MSKDEPPAVSLERLLESYRLYTPIGLEDSNNQRAINLAFVSRSVPDIRGKLQKVERFEGDNLSKLLEVAQCVFKNQEEVMKVTLAEPHGPRPQDTLDWDQDRG